MRAIRLRVSWQTPWLTDVPLRGRIPRSHACATRHIPLSFTFFPAVSLLLGILSTLTRQQPPLAQRRRAPRALSRHVLRPFPHLRPTFPLHAAVLSRPPAGFSVPFLLFAFRASSFALCIFSSLYPTLRFFLLFALLTLRSSRSSLFSFKGLYTCDLREVTTIQLALFAAFVLRHLDPTSLHLPFPAVLFSTSTRGLF